MDKCEYLNIGCGTVRITNHINMDIEDSVLTQCDIVGSVLAIPFPNERFKGATFAHVLEHLHKFKHHLAMREIWRVLKPEGKVYIEVPDFELAMRYYLENFQCRKDYWYHCIYGRDAYEGDTHFSGVDEPYLADLLFGNGFQNLKWINMGQDHALLAVVAEKGNDGYKGRLE